MRAVGGNITYTDENGLNPRSDTPYENGYVVHTFTESGNLEVTESGTVECLIVGGGGAGSVPLSAFEGAGGGAGGVLQTVSDITIGTKAIVVGNGGTAGQNVIVNGEDSSFNNLIAYGGGGGSNGSVAGGSGGSGGGGVYSGLLGGSGVEGQGHDGESNHGGQDRGCGGGGAGEAGGTDLHADGGDGIESSISGTPIYYGGGGGGLGWDGSVYYSGQGGQGGGGNGASTLGVIGEDGEPNTGGGGGGGSNSGGYYLGGDGGSGIVILKYLYSSTPEVDVSTLPASNITQSNFVANGRIDSIGEGITVVKRGFCYKVKE